jgi:hypothetical protein
MGSHEERVTPRRIWHHDDLLTNWLPESPKDIERCLSTLAAFPGAIRESLTRFVT